MTVATVNKLKAARHHASKAIVCLDAVGNLALPTSVPEAARQNEYIRVAINELQTTNECISEALAEEGVE